MGTGRVPGSGGCVEPTGLQLSRAMPGSDRTLLGSGAGMPSPALWAGTSSPHAAAVSTENQLPLWSQKATCSGWSFISTSSTSCHQRQAASFHPSSGHQDGAASFPLSLGSQGLMGWMPFFPFKKGVCLFPYRLPAPLDVQGSLTYTALESPGAWAGWTCGICGPVASSWELGQGH